MGKVWFGICLLLSGFCFVMAAAALADSKTGGPGLAFFFFITGFVALPYTWRSSALKRLSGSGRFGVGVGMMVLAFIGLAVTLHVRGSDQTEQSANAATTAQSDQNSASTQPTAQAPSPAELMKQERPAAEAAFINAVQQGKADYGKASNDMAKGGTRAHRKEALCSALPTPDFTNWTGRITELSSNSEGKGVLAIDLDQGITFVTWNNALSDFTDHTLIDPASDLFKNVSGMKEGDVVRFSGTLIPSDEDCFEENSLLSVDASMTNPHFITRFQDVQPLTAKPPS